MINIKFTPYNLISNIDKIGPWSLCELAEKAITHFYPAEYKKMVKKDGIESTQAMSKLCKDWRGIVIRYQKEIGYKRFRKGYVNQW